MSPFLSSYCALLLDGLTLVYFMFILPFSKCILQNETAGFNGIQTRIIVVECKHADR